MPSPVSMRKLFNAAAKRRVPDSIIEQASIAFNQFEELISEHAGDRESFASMVSALSSRQDGSSEIDLVQRRAAFKANSHIWGLQARVKMGCFIVRPNTDDPSFIDAIFLRGVVGLRQLRRDRPFIMSEIALSDSDGTIRRPAEIERLDTVDSQHGINLLRDFCTTPLPTIRNYINEGQRLVTELINSDVGSSAAFSGFLCDVLRKSDVRYRDEHNHALEFRSFIDNPFETAASDYPRYVDMIEYVMERLGWDPSEFESYRYRQAYPVMHSAVVMETPLPEKP
jgi:hypothetical protein